MVMVAVPPALMVDDIWSMPAMPLSAFSIGMITAEVISSGAAPGQPQRDVDRRRIGAREQIDAEIAERKDAQHHERHHEHRREHWPADAEFRQHATPFSCRRLWRRPVSPHRLARARLGIAAPPPRSPSCRRPGCRRR